MEIKLFNSCLLLILLTAIISANSQNSGDINSYFYLHYWPQPHNLTSSSFDLNENFQLTGKYMSFQLVNHKHNRDLQVKINDLFDLYYNKMFHLNIQDQIKAERMQNVKEGKNLFNATYKETEPTTLISQKGELQVSIDITNPNDYQNETYTLKIFNNQSKYLNAIIESSGYVGFVRALETLSQSIIFIQNNQTFQLQNLPITITDWADYEVRGIMLDCSSSFISISSLKEYIDAMMFNKLNTLVINIVGIGPIRLEIDKNVQKYETYTDGELMDLILYGKIRGVQVILGIESQTGYQLDGELLKGDVICETPKIPLRGELNLTTDNSQSLLKKVVQKAGKISENMMYVGGRELNVSSRTCNQDNLIGRKLACQYLKEFFPEKKCLVYVEGNSENATAIASNIPADSMHIVGASSNSIQNLSYPSITINYQLNLHDGVAPSWATNKNTLVNWPSYKNQAPKTKNKFHMGGLLLLEYQTGISLGARTWIRATVWVESFWNSKFNEQQGRQGQYRRLARIERRLTQWGVRNAPFTCEYCTLNMWDCF